VPNLGSAERPTDCTANPASLQTVTEIRKQKVPFISKMNICVWRGPAHKCGLTMILSEVYIIFPTNMGSVFYVAGLEEQGTDQSSSTSNVSLQNRSPYFHVMISAVCKF
jgi:hypothetical protein